MKVEDNLLFVLVQVYRIDAAGDPSSKGRSRTKNNEVTGTNDLTGHQMYQINEINRPASEIAVPGAPLICCGHFPATPATPCRQQKKKKRKKEGKE